MRTIIFANGELKYPNWARELIHPDDFLIAADGGLRHMRALGVTPNLIIGDMDSLAERELTDLALASVEVNTHPPEKDQTDLELAIEQAIARDGNPILIIAALGGRLEMSIANLMVLGRDDLKGVQASIMDGPHEAFFINGYACVHGQTGESVSLLALGGTARGIRTEGLRYPLRDETLHPHEARGVSNVMLGEKAEIWVADGMLLCVHTQSWNKWISEGVKK